ncbi:MULTISPECIES: hypothetical protein [Leptolyngbya]|nr:MULTISPECIES: hypothetical protein [Leptolyngbya]MBD1854402.1 hypothetical protein [Leptolyngbya sp. FACHB-1624]MBD2368418.1 hypothetical protein [Leptolyngbya sp. FACHB-161]MBD2374926.1 hypothetical protein [Leptolyngbya sp. FACHB-238]MBD2399346.1 hypothetical protein [Leptolyngbya sp. FACHB-239]MBD2405551.1 hypothetical protein [Leptolyngbya sp. FACHB-402]
MNHTFLMQPGRWTLQGNWLEREELPIAVKGRILIAWSRDDWFTMITKLTFPYHDRDEVTLQYRGRLSAGDRRYTFVLQHSQLGRVEGEGLVAPESLVQRHWVLSDRQQRRSSFETLYRLNDDRYYFSSTTLTGHHLNSTMEATLERQAEQNT